MRSILAPLLAAAALLSPLASASNVDAIYYQSQGKVVLPNLKVGNATYYVMLRQIPGQLAFTVDTRTLVNLLPTNFTPAAAADLVGTFSPDWEPTTTLTFNANGTYSMSVSSTDDPSCPKNGGAESGTYQYEPTTGVLTAVALADANGECGLSHPDSPIRIKKEGTQLFVKMREDGVDKEGTLTRK